MSMSQGTLWIVIVALAIGTFGLRFSFLGLVGRKPLPDWVLRLLRYTPVAVIPGLMAPQVFLPQAGQTIPDPAQLAAVAVTLAVGVWTKNAIWAMLGGAAVLAVLTFAV